MGISRDLQEKEIKGMYRAIHGNYPYHIDFLEMSDDEVEQMFNDLSKQLYDKPSDEDEDWREYQRQQQQQASNKMSFFMPKMR